jgi:hypothetical protein
MYAEILVGKYKGKIADISIGETTCEDNLVFRELETRLIPEKQLADQLMDAMMEASFDGRALDQILQRYVRSNDASYLISKYLSNYQVPKANGGCCG